MKKYTTGATLLTLICVPFLVATTSVVNAENTQSTSESATEISSIEEVATKEKTTEVELPKKEAAETTESTIVEKEAKPFEVSTKSLTGEKGQIKLAKIGTVEPEGEFEEFKNDFIKVEKDGTWTALKDGKTKFTLNFTLSDDSLAAIQKENPDHLIKKVNKTEEISADITKPKDQKAEITLEIVGGKLKSVEEKKENGKPLKVQVKGGDVVTGTFKEINTKTFILDKEGYYSIPKEARYEKLNQKVEFTLDEASHKKLVNSDKYKDKTVETTYELDVTKQAQKDIQIRFKNKGINTTVGGQGRLLLEDNAIDPITKKEVKLVGIEQPKFKELKDNDFLSIDELGNWKALKAGSGEITPAVILADNTVAALEKEFPEHDLNIYSETIEVKITETGAGDSGTNKKTYAPVKTLPQTGEQKMKFAGTIGAIIIALAGVIFFFKRKKANEE